jgi:hypothetical protein
MRRKWIAAPLPRIRKARSGSKTNSKTLHSLGFQSQSRVKGKGLAGNQAGTPKCGWFRKAGRLIGQSLPAEEGGLRLTIGRTGATLVTWRFAGESAGSGWVRGLMMSVLISLIRLLLERSAFSGDNPSESCGLDSSSEG